LVVYQDETGFRFFYCIGKNKSIFVWITTCGCFNPAPAPSPSRRFGPANEVKERLQCQALQRLCGLNEALALFVLVQIGKIAGFFARP